MSTFAFNDCAAAGVGALKMAPRDRKSTRLNSSHEWNSYAVFGLKKKTRELAEEQARHYGLEFVAVSRPQGDLLEHIAQRRMFPSPSVRYCTSDHKRSQILKVLTA